MRLTNRNPSFRSALYPTLKPVLPSLILGTIAATMSGGSALLALWCLISFLTSSETSRLASALACFGFAGISTGCSAWICHSAELSFSVALKKQLARHLVRLPSSVLAALPREEIRRRLEGDITALHHMIAHLPGEAAVFITIPTTTLWLLISLCGWNIIIALAPGLMAAICYLVIIPSRMAQQQQDGLNVMQNITTSINEITRGAPILAVCDSRVGPLADYRKATTEFVNLVKYRVGRVATVAAVATSMLQAVATYALVYAVGHDWPAQHLAAALFFSLVLVTPALRLGHGLEYVNHGRAAARRLNEFLSTPTLRFGKNTLVTSNTSALELNGALLHPSNQKTDTKLTQTFKAGCITTITGPSGSGKSTLLRCLAGRDEPKEGQVLLDGVALQHLTEECINEQIFYLPQGSELLDETITANLRLSLPGASEACCLEVLRKARLHLPLDTPGEKLSGGEKQRVNFARALLSPARIVLLDEPTAALDNRNSVHLIEILEHEARLNARIIVIVTHDAEIIARGDYRIDLGRKQPVETRA